VNRDLAVPDPEDTPEARTRRAFAHPARNALRMRADDGTCLAVGFATTAFVGYDHEGIYVEVSVRCETCGTALVFDAPFTNGSSRELGVADAFAKVLNVPVARFATDADEPGHAAAVARAEAQASGQAAAMRFTPDARDWDRDVTDVVSGEHMRQAHTRASETAEEPVDRPYTVATPPRWAFDRARAKAAPEPDDGPLIGTLEHAAEAVGPDDAELLCACAKAKEWGLHVYFAPSCGPDQEYHTDGTVGEGDA
jgi:hypothetical protein